MWCRACRQSVRPQHDPERGTLDCPRCGGRLGPRNKGQAATASLSRMAAEGVDLSHEPFPVPFPITSAAQWIDEAALWRLDDRIRRVQRLAVSRPASARRGAGGGEMIWDLSGQESPGGPTPAAGDREPRFRVDIASRSVPHCSPQSQQSQRSGSNRRWERPPAVPQSSWDATLPRAGRAVTADASPRRFHLILLAAMLGVCGASAAVWFLDAFRGQTWAWPAAVSFLSAQAALMMVLWSLGRCCHEAAPDYGEALSESPAGCRRKSQTNP